MLEQRLMRAHVERCASCARFASDVEAMSIAIRAAPLAPPATPIVVSALALGRRRAFRRIPGAQLAGQLAAVAVGGFLAFTLGSSWSSNTIEVTVPVSPIVIDSADLASVDGELAELRVFRRAELLDQTAAAPRLGKHPGQQPL